MLKKIAPITLAVLLATMGGQAFAQSSDLSPWQVRLRGIAVVPDESADISVIGGDAHVNNDYVPELDITYFLSDHLALELILATTKHYVTAVDTVAGDVPVGSVRLLPPTLTLQYHIIPEGKVRPYVGAGINYTFFYNENPEGTVVNEMRVKNSFGFALQAGIDFALSENWMFNVDVKKVFLDTTAYLNDEAIVAKIKIDPWIFGVGFGYRV